MKIYKEGTKIKYKNTGECGVILENDLDEINKIEQLSYYIEFEDTSRGWCLHQDLELINIAYVLPKYRQYACRG